MSTVILVVIFAWPAHSSHEKRYPMHSMEECLASVQAAAVKHAERGDAEGGVVVFCANSERRRK